jgi:hypothetical protein
MESERLQIVLKVKHLTQEDRYTLPRALMNLEGVCNAVVDEVSGVVHVDGAATDVELLQALRALGKDAVVVTQTRGINGATPRAHASSSAGLRLQLFLKLLRRNVDCCS